MATLAQPRVERATRSARIAQDPLLVGLGVVVVVALALMLIQVAVLVWASLRPGMLEGAGGLTLANFDYVFTHQSFRSVLTNTLLLGAGSTAVMLLFAVPFAWLYTRTDLPRKELLLIILTVKIAIPGFLVAMGYIYLFNPSNGIGNRIAIDLLGFSAPPFNVYTLGWIALLQGAALVSPAFFMIVPTFRAIDAALEEAAYVSGIRQTTTSLRIVVPLAAPAILATSVYYFIIAIESFDYPGTLGLPVRMLVFSTWMYQLVHPPFGQPRYGEAAAMGVLMSIGAIVLTLVYLWATRQSDRYTVVTGKRSQQRSTRLSGWTKVLAWVFILAYSSLVLFIPLFMLVWSSLLPYLQVPSPAALGLLSLDAYRTAFNELPPLIVNTLSVMIVVPTLSVILATAVALIVVRTRLPGRRVIDMVVMIAIAVPSIVGGLAFLYLGLSIYQIVPIYTSIWIITLAMSSRYITWANRTISSALVQVHRELEEACSTSGIRRGRAFLSVLLPTVAPALLVSGFWLALLSLRELTIPLMLARPNTQVLATAIWGFNAAGTSSVASAMGVTLVVIIGIMVLIFHKVAGHRGV